MQKAREISAAVYSTAEETERKRTVTAGEIGGAEWRAGERTENLVGRKSEKQAGGVDQAMRKNCKEGERKA